MGRRTHSGAELAVGLGLQFQVLNGLSAGPALGVFGVLVRQAGWQQECSVGYVAGNVRCVNIHTLSYVVSAQ